jgi:hypothetical protein
MLFTRSICCLAAIVTTAVAQAAYPLPSVSTVPASSVSVASSTPSASSSAASSQPTISVSSITTSTTPLSSSSVQMTAHVMPINCTESCTTVTEPCPYDTTASPAPYGTGSWTAPPAPPATGGYVAPPPASTWVRPLAPSATPISEPSASSSVVPYTGDAAGRLMGSGLVLAMVGLLHVVV